MYNFLIKIVLVVAVGLAGIGIVHPELHGQAFSSAPHSHPEHDHGSQQAACSIASAKDCEADDPKPEESCGLELAHCPSVFLLSAGNLSDRLTPGEERFAGGPENQLISQELGFDPPPPKTV